MLTDRQKKFYDKIVVLSFPESQTTGEEKKYFSQAKSELERGRDFKQTINTLDKALKALDFGKLQDGGLTPEAKQLFEDLKEAYGEPVNNDVYAKNLANVSKRATTFNKANIVVSLVIILAVIVR